MTDLAQSVAFNPAAPPDEQFEAMADLQRTYAPSSATALIPREDIRQVIDHINDGLAEAAFLKASGNQVIPFPGRTKGMSPTGARSVRLDEQQTNVLGDYYDKNSAMSFEALRDLVLRTPMLSMIVQTRIKQVMRFCQPSEDGGLGFAIVHEEKRKTLEGEDVEIARQLTKFFKNCGWEFNPRKRKLLKRDSFTQFMAKSVWDTLAMDSAPIETEMKRGRGAGMDGFYAVDGSTIRLCTEQGYEGDDEVYALQVLQGRVSASYTHEQLIYEVRNPRADVRLCGYGLAEPELLVRIITGWLNGFSYNSNSFDANAIPKGLLHLTGNYGQEDMVAFKRYWNMMVKGVNNAWSLPVLVSKDQESKASFEKFGVEFDEMAFAKWMTLCMSIACAVYNISPEEINFESFSAQKSALGGSDPETRITESKDKGLRPLLSYYEAQFTDFIVSAFSDHLCFRWVGLDAEDPKQKWEEDKTALTWGELRKKRGDAPLADPSFESMPVNPSFIGPWQAKMQMQMQAEQQQQQPEPDYGKDPGGDDGFGGPDGNDQPGQAGWDDQSGDAGAEEADTEAAAAMDVPAGGGGGGAPFGKALDSMIFRLGD